MHIIPWVYDATWCNLECWKVHVKSPPRMIACKLHPEGDLGNMCCCQVQLWRPTTAIGKDIYSVEVWAYMEKIYWFSLESMGESQDYGFVQNNSLQERRCYTPKLNFVGIKCQCMVLPQGLILCWEIFIKVYIKKIIGACEHAFHTFICWEQFARDRRRSRSQSNIAGCM